MSNTKAASMPGEIPQSVEDVRKLLERFDALAAQQVSQGKSLADLLQRGGNAAPLQEILNLSRRFGQVEGAINDLKISLRPPPEKRGFAASLLRKLARKGKRLVEQANEAWNEL